MRFDGDIHALKVFLIEPCESIKKIHRAFGVLGEMGKDCSCVAAPYPQFCKISLHPVLQDLLNIQD